ncbi:LytTR family transcriptional regulator DNA-binding domain-containing protein [Nostoc sp. CHAB 5834]|nr:LytTR family transcriptional regulator DNA-binding domain-containing protein [Nostoc sp. CHAB 5834]
MLHAIIIDDEPNAIGLLTIRLSQHCPQVKVVAACTKSHQGIQAILDYRPDLVFLDIEMPQLNGFQVLDAVSEVSFALIFVTAYDQFALKAFRYSAIDYLLKPLVPQELVNAVQRVEKSRKLVPEQMEHLKQQLYNPIKTLPDRIALPYQNGVTFVELKEILYCESDDSNTKFFLTNGLHYLVTKPLKDIQELLEEREFLRIHRQFVINLNQIKKFVRGEGCYIVMTNGQSIPVSRSRRDQLLERFGWI